MPVGQTARASSQKKSVARMPCAGQPRTVANLTCGCRIGHPYEADLGIFVDQSAEPVVASEAKVGW